MGSAQKLSKFLDWFRSLSIGAASCTGHFGGLENLMEVPYMIPLPYSSWSQAYTRRCLLLCEKLSLRTL